MANTTKKTTTRDPFQATPGLTVAERNKLLSENAELKNAILREELEDKRIRRTRQKATQLRLGEQEIRRAHSYWVGRHKVTNKVSSIPVAIAAGATAVTYFGMGAFKAQVASEVFESKAAFRNLGSPREAAFARMRARIRAGVHDQILETISPLRSAYRDLPEMRKADLRSRLVEEIISEKRGLEGAPMDEMGQKSQAVLEKIKDLFEDVYNGDDVKVQADKEAFGKDVNATLETVVDRRFLNWRRKIGESVGEIRGKRGIPRIKSNIRHILDPPVPVGVPKSQMGRNILDLGVRVNSALASPVARKAGISLAVGAVAGVGAYAYAEHRRKHTDPSTRVKRSWITRKRIYGKSGESI